MRNSLLPLNQQGPLDTEHVRRSTSPIHRLFFFPLNRFLLHCGSIDRSIGQLLTNLTFLNDSCVAEKDRILKELKRLVHQA